MRGRFISFEGGEGSGKSTQIRRLADRLRAGGIDVVTTREPGGTPGAEAIRRLVVEGEAGRWDGTVEALLMNAARADHVARLIRPALDAGQWILTDRYAHSTIAYQGAGRGIAEEALLALHRFATGDLWPDLTLILDVDPAEGLARAASRGGAEARFEGEAAAFHARVRERMLDFAGAPGCIRIDAGAPLDAVAAAIWAEVAARFGLATS